MDVSELARLVTDGRVVEAAPALAALAEADIALVAGQISQALPGAEAIDVINSLVGAAPPVPLDHRARLLCLEAMRHLAAHLAVESVDDDWEDLLVSILPLAGEVSFRVRESLVPVIARVASRFFKESRGFWAESLLEQEFPLAGLVLRGLAASTAPVPAVLDLFSTVISDIRRDVRHNLGPRAIPELGRRDPRTVYARLKEWADLPDEIVRWNVAKALATPLGGIYPEDAASILEALAADERAAVWRAAAEAAAQLAQRRPAFVLPILARWRTERARMRCALLALDTLAKR